jgi:hypothetical protein
MVRRRRHVFCRNFAIEGLSDLGAEKTRSAVGMKRKSEMNQAKNAWGTFSIAGVLGGPMGGLVGGGVVLGLWLKSFNKFKTKEL